jgi:hypothetical protein
MPLSSSNSPSGHSAHASGDERLLRRNLERHPDPLLGTVAPTGQSSVLGTLTSFVTADPNLQCLDSVAGINVYQFAGDPTHDYLIARKASGLRRRRLRLHGGHALSQVQSAHVSVADACARSIPLRRVSRWPSKVNSPDPWTSCSESDETRISPPAAASANRLATITVCPR